MVEPDPENSIRILHSGTASGSECDVKLVAEYKVFKGDVTTGPEAGKNATKHDEDDLKHPAG
jgi:hypothetical protein